MENRFSLTRDIVIDSLLNTRLCDVRKTGGVLTGGRDHGGLISSAGAYFTVKKINHFYYFLFINKNYCKLFFRVASND